MTYEEVLPFIKRSFPEWWLFLCEYEEEGSGGVHMGSGALVHLLDEGLRMGAIQFAERAAHFANALSESKDPRVENVLYVSFFENMDCMRPSDLASIERHLSPKARTMLAEMVPEIDGPSVKHGSKRR